jgi:hypothetical protein
MVRQIFTLLCCVISYVVNAQDATIKGRVEHDGKPVPFATVALSNKEKISSDSTGYFVFTNRREGVAQIRVTATGYQSGHLKQK